MQGQYRVWLKSDEEVSPVDVASFIVGYYIDRNHPVNRDTIMSMMYLLWIEYYRDQRQYLISKNFSAWSTGPVSLEAFHRIDYSQYSSGENVRPQFNIAGLNGKVMKNILDKYIVYPIERINVGLMSDFGAWKKARDAANSFYVIPFEDMIALDCENFDKMTSLMLSA